MPFAENVGNLTPITRMRYLDLDNTRVTNLRYSSIHTAVSKCLHKFLINGLGFNDYCDNWMSVA